MALEFDPQCGTAQGEDSLQLYIPAKGFKSNLKWASLKKSEDDELASWWPVYKKFSGTSNWPTLGLILPGIDK